MSSFSPVFRHKQLLYVVHYQDNGQTRSKSFTIAVYGCRRNAYIAAYEFAHEKNNWILPDTGENY